MTLQYRPMEPNDVAPCVEIVASHPYLGPRYGSGIARLGHTWHELLGRLAFTAVVFEEWVDGTGPRLVGAGISAFVSDVFLHDIKSPPLCWIGPEIVKSTERGESSVLSDKELAEGNTRGGLNLVGVHGATRIEDMKRPEILNFIFSSFIELHRGFSVKELLGQADSPEVLQAMRNSGGSFFDPECGTFVPSIAGTPDEIVAKPHLIGSTRDAALAGTWLSGSAIFAYQPPRFGFTRSEQRLLTAALRGYTDQELSAQLAISNSVVRRSWLSIYERVASQSPEVLGQHEHTPASPLSVRGKSKKHRLLAYLHDHPEELRPTARTRKP
ncbi:MAG TPA: hypothetical protein VIO32_01490 [Candidatus Baltobacteraceae bacterium]